MLPAEATGVCSCGRLRDFNSGPLGNLRSGMEQAGFIGKWWSWLALTRELGRQGLHSEQTVVSVLLFTLFAGSLAARWERLWGTPKGVFVSLWVLAGALFAGAAQPLPCFPPQQLSALSGRWEGLQGRLAGRVVQILPGGDSHLARMS